MASSAGLQHGLMAFGCLDTTTREIRLNGINASNQRPDKRLQDCLEFDAPLASWFHDFLSKWVGPLQVLKEAAE